MTPPMNAVAQERHSRPWRQFSDHMEREDRSIFLVSAKAVPPTHTPSGLRQGAPWCQGCRISSSVNCNRKKRV